MERMGISSLKHKYNQGGARFLSSYAYCGKRVVILVIVL